MRIASSTLRVPVFPERVRVSACINLVGHAVDCALSVVHLVCLAALPYHTRRVVLVLCGCI